MTGPQVVVSLVKAPDSEGLTLDDLAAFVQDAMRRDVPGATPVRVVVTGWRGRLKSITVGPT